REHLQIMDLLGVKRGLIALSKIDLAEPDMAELVAEEIREMVKGTFLEEAEICPISVVTGQGMEAFWDRLNAMVEATPARSTEGVFRMPVQRVFSAKGFGTIVTGVPLSGHAKPGDILEVLPIAKRGRVRSLQAYKGEVNEVRAGHSSAINLADINHTEVGRGFVVATPGYFQASRHIQVRFQAVRDLARPIRNLTSVRLHTGTVEALGRVILLDRKDVLPGDAALLQVRLVDPIVAAPGDYFVLRLQSPTVTLGGGRILTCDPTRLRRFREEVLQDLKYSEEALGDERKQVEHVVRRSGLEPVPIDTIDQRAGLGLSRTRPHVEALLAEGRLRHLPESGRYVHRDPLPAARERILAAVRQSHAKNPMGVGLPRLVLRTESGLDPELYAVLLPELLRERALAETHELIHLPAHRVALDESLVRLGAEIERALLERKFATPGPKELYASLGAAEADVERLLKLLGEQGVVYRFKDDVLLHRDAVEEAKSLLLKTIADKGAVESAEFRDLLGTTRKYVIPLLEYFDATGLTVRDGNRRTLKRKKG
ncbi:MAG: SelB C-terminal domain-containing protein, partial [Planctomycetes bacterium]|nr:SelB C-terminal domain-containing protein [Planctomycetota bacterium]